MTVEIDIVINDERWTALGFDTESTARSGIQAALANAAWPAGLKAGRALELCALLTDDTEVRTLNRDFRGKDKPTNILSFAAVDDPGFTKTAALPGPFYLGDLALALETLQREAAEQEKPLKDHFTHLVVHGTLHLLGYDHMQNDEADIMEAIEIKVLSGLGIENPYRDPLFVPD